MMQTASRPTWNF